MLTEIRKHELMQAVESYAKFSNCKSRRLACMIMDSDGDLIAVEHNRTANPVCINKECFKRLMGDKAGPSLYCKAVHAEEGAAAVVKYKTLKDPQYYKALKKPFIAIMNCGYPCGDCLHELFTAGVRHLVLKDKTFYTKEDEEIWNRTFSKTMTVESLK